MPLPYAPGGSVVWTTVTYEVSWRRVSLDDPSATGQRVWHFITTSGFTHGLVWKFEQKHMPGAIVKRRAGAEDPEGLCFTDYCFTDGSRGVFSDTIFCGLCDREVFLPEEPSRHI